MTTLGAPEQAGSVCLSPREQRLLALINRDELVAVLQALVQARSDNPLGDCRRAAQVASVALLDAGLLVDLFVRRPHQPNVVATLGLLEAPPRLMFHAHLDTAVVTDPEAWLLPPFGGEIRGDYLYGRGAQAKASAAAQIMAAVALARADELLIGGLQVVLSADAEAGGRNGARWLHDSGLLMAKALVIGAPTSNRIAVAERAAMGLRLTVSGRPTGCRQRPASENAALQLNRVRVWLNERFLPRLALRRQAFLPPATLTFGPLLGRLPWITDSECSQAVLYRMLLPGETRFSALAELRAALDEYSASVETLRYELVPAGEEDDTGCVNTPADHPFVQLAQDALAEVSGHSQPLTGSAQPTDGRWFARDGVPIIMFGPGQCNACPTDEHIRVDDVVAAARMLALLALRRLGI